MKSVLMWTLVFLRIRLWNCCAKIKYVGQKILCLIMWATITKLDDWQYRSYSIVSRDDLSLSIFQISIVLSVSSWWILLYDVLTLYNYCSFSQNLKWKPRNWNKMQEQNVLSKLSKQKYFYLHKSQYQQGTQCCWRTSHWNLADNLFYVDKQLWQY